MNNNNKTSQGCYSTNTTRLVQYTCIVIMLDDFVLKTLFSGYVTLIDLEVIEVLCFGERGACNLQSISSVMLEKEFKG